MGLAHIRQELLAEHASLRERLLELAPLCEEMARGNGSLGPRVQRLAQQFTAAFLEHVDREEETLEPLLPDIDAWGPQRLAQLKEEHEHQHRLLGSFLARLAFIQSPRRLGELIQALIAAVLIDMENEERELLTPELFRNDVVAIDQLAG
jgi:iron-sulfur cluster repair protein YtfE (RIC family)